MDYPNKHFYNLDNLIPVDAYVRNLQKQVDDMYWENDLEDVHKVERDLKHFQSLQAEGIDYEPTF